MTVAVSWVDPLTGTVTVVGDTCTERTRSVTVMVTLALFVGSAWLVATAW